MSEYTAKPGDDDFESQVSELMHAGPERTITMADGHVGQEVIARQRRRRAAIERLIGPVHEKTTTPIFTTLPLPEPGLGRQRLGERIKEFNRIAGHPVRETPQIISYLEASEVMNWAFFGEENITSEVEELVCAFADNDLPQIADALGDIVYLMYVLAIRHGIDLDAVLDEIHRSNMTKFEDGKPVFYPGTNKVAKGKNYEEPNIVGILNLEQDDETGAWRYAG